MAGSASPGSNLLRKYGSGIALVLAWAVTPLLTLVRHNVARHAIEDAIIRILSGFPGLQIGMLRLYDALETGVVVTFGVSLFVATLAVPLGFVTRMVARARLRAGHADPLDRVRRWIAAHPRWTALLAAMLPAAWQVLFVDREYLWDESRGQDMLPMLLVVAFAMGAAQWAQVRAGLRALLAPTVADAEGAAITIDPDEIRFDAVAVTRETRGAVGALATLSLAAVAWMASLDIQRLYRDPRLFTAMVAYVVVAATSALIFRRASKIAVGVDGIRVGGTSRTRFYAYRDLDEVRERHGDIELMRRGRVLLRLQLHGQDAARRGAILERMRDGITRVAAVERDGAANFVGSVSPGTVARSMRGGANYRVPSVSRDALWSLVEGAGVDAAARTAAAQAIAETVAPEERERLRVAAGHCADPRVRVALEELAGDAPGALAEHDGREDSGQGEPPLAVRSSRA